MKSNWKVLFIELFFFRVRVSVTFFSEKEVTTTVKIGKGLRGDAKEIVFSFAVIF